MFGGVRFFGVVLLGVGVGFEVAVVEADFVVDFVFGSDFEKLHHQ